MTRVRPSHVVRCFRLAGLSGPMAIIVFLVGCTIGIGYVAYRPISAAEKLFPGYAIAGASIPCLLVGIYCLVRAMQRAAKESEEEDNR